MSSQTSKNDAKLEKEILGTMQEVFEFTQKSMSNLQNEKNLELQKYTSEAIGFVTKTTQLIQKLLVKLAETEKGLRALEQEHESLKTRKTRTPKLVT